MQGPGGVAAATRRDLAPVSGRASNHNIPPAVSSFLGRAAELGELAQLLAGTRLVTLTGAPGIGKSRLATELARGLAAGYGDGARLVELAPASEDAHVAAAIAAALSIAEVSGEDLTATLLARAESRHLLLVLDNCEHLVEASARLVAALLARCPGLSVLATSREPLRVPGETVWQVPALPVPDGRALPLDEYDAVRLFVERARALEPGFELTSFVAAAVAQICRRLDGMPLAIELAAGRVGSLTPAEIARRLDDRFGLLTTGRPGVSGRRQTLEAALDWSYTALSSSERTLLRRLAVFAGGFSAEAAEAVCAGDGLPRGRSADLIARLAMKSLVSEIDGSMPARYRLLETVRAYAAERLDEAGEAGALREAHAGYYLALAERAEPELTGADQERWLDRLESERQNLRTALEWSLSYARRESSLRLAGSLVLFWRVRGHFSEGRRLLMAALSAADGSAPALEAKVLWGAGFLAHMAGDSDAAVPLLEHSWSRFSELGDRSGCARALLLLGNCWQQHDGPRALALLQESASLARRAGDSWCLAHALGIAGFGHAYRDDLATARPLFEECLAVARKAGDKQSRRLGVLGLGSVAVYEGDYEAAVPLLEEAVALAEELGEDYTKVAALQYLGQVAIGRGDVGRARELLDGALGLARAAGLGDLVLPLVARAHVARAEGDPQGARRLLHEALALSRAGAASPGPALRGLAALDAEQGDAPGARRLFE
ncbi:MAG TPA: tetratricopeptide repeat protein, partial [Solirubrobacteraceae bacterium]|nr:tetratricopeptide repeat protein [Solirubrobacteraceae bacterium]